MRGGIPNKFQNKRLWPFSRSALAATLCLHLGVFSLLLLSPLKPLPEINSKSLSVQIVELPAENPPAPLPKAKQPVSIKPIIPVENMPTEIEPKTEVLAIAKISPIALPLPDILQSMQITTGDEGEMTVPKNHVPSRWALKPPLIEEQLEGLGLPTVDIECLWSLEADCQDLRKDIFAKYQLSETELVWTPNRADTGMPVEFQGLNHQQIMEKLGMNYAGGNAFAILPGIAIDGPLWDMLHGVNKTCRLVAGVEPDQERAGEISRQGRNGAKRVCD